MTLFNATTVNGVVPMAPKGFSNDPFMPVAEL